MLRPLPPVVFFPLSHFLQFFWTNRGIKANRYFLSFNVSFVSLFCDVESSFEI